MHIQIYIYIKLDASRDIYVACEDCILFATAEDVLHNSFNCFFNRIKTFFHYLCFTDWP